MTKALENLYVITCTPDTQGMEYFRILHDIVSNKYM